MYPQQGLGAFWPDSGKGKDVGSLPSAYPSLLDPTILLPFRGLRGGKHRAAGQPCLSWECFRSVGGTPEGLFWSPGTQRHRSSGKEDKGDILVLGQGGDSQERSPGHSLLYL